MLKTSVFPCETGKNGPFLSGKRREFNVDKMWKLLKMFGFSGLQEHKVRQVSQRMLDLLREAATGPYQDVPMIALDPTPAAVVRVAGKYRYKMLIKARNTKRMRDLVRELLHTINGEPMARGVSVYVDINPASIL